MFTFEVDNVTPAQTLLHEASPEELFQEEIVKTSIKEKLVPMGDHTVFQGFIDAYREHRPIVISPDILWMLIIQGFTYHIDAHAEALRKCFVDFTGKVPIEVVRLDMDFRNGTDRQWQGVFAEYTQSISKKVKGDLVSILSSDFTTTTPDIEVAFNISIMASVKHYFSYRLKTKGCGFPEINIEGETYDYEMIIEKLEKLASGGYGIKFWVDVLIPIFKEIINTLEGDINLDFWRSLIREYHKGRPIYDPAYVDGWICSFFPYAMGKRTNLTRIYLNTKMSSEILRVPFILIDEHRKEERNCEFLTGFFGLIQDRSTKSLKPKIGWAVRYAD